MTRDCDQSERVNVPAEHSSQLLVNTESLSLFTFLKEI